MYGKYFNKLRTLQEISLKDAAKDVISISQLSRWENGKSNIPFYTVIKLLNNIHIRASEFISYCKLNPTNPLIYKITIAYQRKDLAELKKLTLEQINLAHSSKNKFDLFLEITAASFYFDLTNTLLVDKTDILKVKSVLSSTSYWNYYYTSIWGNTLTFYDTKFNFKIASKILTILKNKNSLDVSTEYYTWCTVINALIRLIHDDIDLAKKLSAKIDQIGISETYLSVKLKKKFMDIYINYRLHKSTYTELDHFLDSLKNLGINNLENELQYFLNHTSMKD